MTHNRQDELDIGTLLGAWTDITPDPQAMEQVAVQMVAAVTAARRPGSDQPTEVQFRLLTYLWAGLAVGGYFARNMLMDWFFANPTLISLLIVFGCLCLISPLLLLPILVTSDERRSSPC